MIPYETSKSGLRLRCRLTPRSSVDRVLGLHEMEDGQAIKCSVRAIPEKGKANAALEKLIATWLGVPRSCVNVSTGARSRYKSIEISGDPDALEQVVSARISDLVHGN